MLTGPARACYHGMPRLLDEQPLDALKAPSGTASQADEIAKYLSEHRVNISLRRAAPCLGQACMSDTLPDEAEDFQTATASK